MSVQIIVEMRVKPEAFEDVAGGLKQNLPETRKFPGCEDVHAYRVDGEKGLIVLVERWASKQDYEKYLAWRQSSGIMDQMGSIMVQMPQVRYLELID